MTKATLTTTRSGRPRATVDPVAVAAEVESLKARVDGHDKVLAPAFAAPKETTVTQPQFDFSVIRHGSGSGGGMDWSQFPDHDPDYLSGKITLDQAKGRHQRPDEGCQCPNCAHDRKVTAQRYAAPDPVPEARCPFCRGTGSVSPTHPDASWTPCTACDAETFLRLQRESYNGNQYSVPSAPLVAARERVEACAECGGSGKVRTAVPLAPCSPCRGTGRDNHLAMPAGVLWPRANGTGEVVKDTSGGSPSEQHTMWTTRPEPDAMPEPVSATTPVAAADAPGFMHARAHGAAITRPRGT